jgi:hypothetical protein
MNIEMAWATIRLHEIERTVLMMRRFGFYFDYPEEVDFLLDDVGFPRI